MSVIVFLVGYDGYRVYGSFSGCFGGGDDFGGSGGSYGCYCSSG